MKPSKIKDSESIVYLKGDANYTVLHYKNGKSEMACVTLKRYEEYLKSFIRVSRSHLVNPKYVNRIANDGSAYQLELRNGNRVTVSRRKQSLLEGLRITLTTAKI